KSREKDLNSFRVLKYHAGQNQQEKGSDADPAQAIQPGLRYVNGARVSAQPWVAAIAGDLNKNGDITSFSLFSPSHQGLDLLGIKYVLFENGSKQDAVQDMTEIDGVGFLKDRFELRLAAESRLNVAIPATTASEIAVVSNLGNSLQVTDGAAVCEIKLHTK